MSLPRTIVTGEYYHVYNRAAHKRLIFHDRKEYARFLFGVLYYQSPVLFPNVKRLTQTFDSLSGFDVGARDFEDVVRGRGVELVAFCIMPNHFHLLLRELIEGGIARYLQRVQESYAKYYNLKYDSSGHLFQGPYKSVHVADNEYLMYLSTYIHKNPRDWQHYPWSSYQDYVKENRWGGLLAQEIILDQFDGTKRSNYSDFIKTSPAKGLNYI